MSQQTHKDPIEEARLLLPWYITGKLSEAEKALVDAALKQYPVLQEEYTQELKLVETIRLNADLLKLTAMDTTQQRLDKLLKRIDREEMPVVAEPPVQVKPVARPSVSLWQTVQQFIAGWVGGNSLWKPANVVFASLLAVQVGVLALYYMQPKTLYETVTYEDTTTSSTKAKNLVVFVDFNQKASVTNVHNFLKQWNARVIDGPDSNDLFKIEFKNTQTLSESDVKQRIAQLEQEKAVVNFVGREF
jgi:hypothetical protein